MAWGESGTGENLTLDYGAMCNDLCKCNNSLGYCLESNKNSYKIGRWKNACEKWFPNDWNKQQICKQFADGGLNEPPTSKADYENKFWTFPDRDKNFSRFPCSGLLPGETNYNQSYLFWRQGIFDQHTGCQQVSNCATCVPNCPDNADAETGYFTNEINGVYYGTLQPVSVRQLYSYSNPCSGWSSRKSADKFCSNLKYANGTIIPQAERPAACGGNGPDISNYSPCVQAYNNALGDIKAIENKLVKDMEKKAETLKIVWAVTILIVIIILIMRFVKL